MEKKYLRPRSIRIAVLLNKKEKETITTYAKASGMSESAYLRSLGLNQKIKSKIDLSAIDELVKINADLGRVAGLLKLWLATKKGEGARPIEVEQLMFEFRDLQKQIRDLMAAALK